MAIDSHPSSPRQAWEQFSDAGAKQYAGRPLTPASGRRSIRSLAASPPTVWEAFGADHSADSTPDPGSGWSTGSRPDYDPRLMDQHGGLEAFRREGRAAARRGRAATTGPCPSESQERAATMRHRIKHHVNRPVLHMGLFTDAQMLPAAGLFAVAAGWFYAGGGALVGAGVGRRGAAVAGGGDGGRQPRGRDRDRAGRARWCAGIASRASSSPAPSGRTATSCSVDDEDQLLLERERLARVDLEAAFAQDG